MTDLPTGTVTFLFTDIEGSTNLARTLGDRWRDVLEEHNGILRRAIRDHYGVDLRTEGDAFFAVFRSAVDAVAATAEAQRELVAHRWPDAGRVRVRMAMHTGEGRLGGDEYVGVDVHRAARIAAAGHGGQALLSESTRSLAAEKLPDGVTLRDLGKHRLKDFDQPQRIYQLVIEDLPSDFPGLKTLEVPTNLPAELTSFVGREREIGQIRDLLHAARLVTLTGPGGTGKTRLALQASRASLDDFRDGVWFVDLAPLTDPRLVAPEVAQSLGVADDGTRPVVEAVVDHLRHRHSLLLLDNFEQVAEGAGTVEALLSGAPSLRVLVTSRVVLHLYGEREFAVPPLPVPEHEHVVDLDWLLGFESVALFVERAREVNRDFELTRDNASPVGAICARLEGLPLAIELAASRIKVLGPQELLERLARRLPLLAGGARNVPERQRTLRRTIEWSYDLLEKPERALLNQLSVFAGGWTIGAAEAVCNPAGDLGVEVLEALASLIDNSLIRQTEAGPGETRFGMLETIREYAAEELAARGEADRTAERHARYFLALGQEAEPHLEAEDPAVWLDRIEREHDNFRAALRWAIQSGQSDLAQRIGAALWRFWYQRGYLREGANWLDEALAIPGPRDAVRASAHTAAAGIAYWRTDYDHLRPHYEEALAISEELGDRRGEMEALYNLGFVPMVRGDYAASISFWEQSVAIARELDDRAAVARAGFSIGMAMMTTEPVAALPFLEEARAFWKEAGSAHRFAESTAGVGWAHRRAGSLEQAERYYREAFDIFYEEGNLPQMAAGLDAFAAIASERGLHERAMRLTGAARALKERIEGRIPLAAMVEEDLEPAARGAIGDEPVDAALVQGRSMTVEQAVQYALGDEP